MHAVALLTDQITSLLLDYGYVAIFVLMALESACVPIPSEVTMLFGGALTSAAVAGPGAELSIFWVGFAGVAGNLVGSWLAYWVGWKGGRPMIDRYGRYLLIRPHEVDRAHTWFETKGEAAVFGARLLPVVRTFISLPAGIARMPFWKFTLFTVLGLRAVRLRAHVPRACGRPELGAGPARARADLVDHPGGVDRAGRDLRGPALAAGAHGVRGARRAARARAGALVGRLSARRPRAAGASATG